MKQGQYQAMDVFKFVVTKFAERWRNEDRTEHEKSETDECAYRFIREMAPEEIQDNLMDVYEVEKIDTTNG